MSASITAQPTVCPAPGDGGQGEWKTSQFALFVHTAGESKTIHQNDGCFSLIVLHLAHEVAAIDGECRQQFYKRIGFRAASAYRGSDAGERVCELVTYVNGRAKIEIPALARTKFANDPG